MSSASSSWYLSLGKIMTCFSETGAPVVTWRPVELYYKKCKNHSQNVRLTENAHSSESNETI